MFDYLKKTGIPIIAMPGASDEINALIKDTIVGIESMSDSEFEAELESMTSNAEKWFGMESDRYLDLLMGENYGPGIESAYTVNRSLIKGAWIRLKMAFKVDGERAMVEYAEVFKNVDPSMVKPGFSQLMIGKESVVAYDECMHVAKNMIDAIDKQKLSLVLREFATKLNNRYIVVILTLMSSSVPFLNFVAMCYLLYLVWVMTRESEEMYSEYSDKIKAILMDTLTKSGITKVVGGTANASNGVDMNTLLRSSEYLFKLRTKMLPIKLRRKVGFWDIFKDTTPVSYDDKIAMATIIKENSSLYLNMLGSSPTQMSNVMRFVLSSDKLAQEFSDGTLGGATESSAYMGLASNFMLFYLDILNVTFVLVRDLKRY